MKERWIVYTKKADFAGIAKRFGINQVTARIMRNRDVTGEEEIETYLNGGIEKMHSPHLMKDAELAAELLDESVRRGEKIAVASDFDNDGIFSAMILYEGITDMGGRARIYTPHRVREGYGLNDRIVRQAYEEGCSVMLTCDNGIAAFEAVELAKQLGMTVIVTDHHEVPYRETENGRCYIKPAADAIVNPKQEDCPYPYKNLCGAGVAYKLMQLFYERRKRDPHEITRFLDYAAIATVADVMELTGENRIIVKEGLDLLHRTDRIGLKALMEATQIEPRTLNAYHIGFIIGPCFNAAGRLETVKIALELLMCRDKEKAAELAAGLKALNEERKDMTQAGVELAQEVIEQAPWKQDKVYLVYLRECHESIAGIIAGRLREKYARPVLVFTDASEEGMIKASGRSIEAYHMFEQLNTCRDLFERFGGHKMAAGLTMRREYLEELRRRLRENCPLTKEDLCPVIRIDAAMPLGYITEELVEELGRLEPFGRGNEKPLFAQQHVEILKLAKIGKNRNVLKMQVCGPEQIVMDALYFGDADEFCSFLEQEYGTAAVSAALRGTGRGLDIAVTYYPQVNEFRDRRTLQIVIQNYCRVAKKQV